MSTSGQELFNQITAGLWSVLERYRSQAAATLAGLAAEPGVAGTPLAGLLQELRPDDIAAGDPGVSALIHGLLQVLPTPGPGAVATLHGFDPGAGQPRGLALVVVTPNPAVTFVVAITGAGPTQLAFEFLVAGAGAFGPTSLALAAAWSLAISGSGGGRLQFPRGGPASVIDAQPPLSVQLLLEYSGAPIELGADAGPHVTLTHFSVGVQTTISADGTPKVAWTIDLPQAQLSLVAGVVSALLGDSLSIPMDLDVTADPELGFALKGGGLRATLPANLSLPGVDISGVDLAVSTSGADVQFAFGLSFTATLPGFPLLSVTATGLGASFPVSTGTSNLGLNVAAIAPALPSGLGLDLALPVITGGGFLQTIGPGGYGGVLELNLLVLTIEAFGLLQLPVDGKPFSFVAIICVEFPFPGIDLEFGFALAGVGGIVAVNRRLDTDALAAAIVDGSASRLLFPVDPAAHAPAIVATLGQVFPEADNHLVVGPMLKISWGGRIVSMVVAVVADLPAPLQFVIIGRVVVALPDPLVPLVYIQATFAGAFELSPTPSFTMVASLDGSYIEGMPLNGDMFFLLRGGSDPDFVFSAGGFHPRYTPPKEVPANMQRLQLAMTPPGVPGLRAHAYFAVTTNSVQFGAQLELCDEIAGCGVDGWFAFDALFKWDPVFSFSISASAGVAVQVIGQTLMGVNFVLVVEGPAPWHVHGTGSVSLFLFSASLDFDATWGSAPPALAPPQDLGVVLKASLALPAAWVGTPPTGEDPTVSLSASARNQVSGSQSVHPLGSVTVRQRAVPFDIQISRFQQQAIPTQTWSISAASVAPNIPVAKITPTTDAFPPGELLDLTEDEKLSWPAFEQWNSGAALTVSDHTYSDLRPVDTDYEVSLVPDFTVVTGPALDQFSLAFEALLAVVDVYATTALWHPPGVPVVTVLAAQPVTAATTDTLVQAPGFAAAESFTATRQAAQTQFGSLGPAAAVQIVESWEVGQ
jgi:hypothetical protein